MKLQIMSLSLNDEFACSYSFTALNIVWPTHESDLVLIPACELRFLEVRFFLFKRSTFLRHNKNLPVSGSCIIIPYLLINSMNSSSVVSSGNPIIKEKHHGCSGLITELEGFPYIEKTKNKISFQYGDLIRRVKIHSYVQMYKGINCTDQASSLIHYAERNINRLHFDFNETMHAYCTSTCNI